MDAYYRIQLKPYISIPRIQNAACECISHTRSLDIIIDINSRASLLKLKDDEFRVSYTVVLKLNYSLSWKKHKKIWWQRFKIPQMNVNALIILKYSRSCWIITVGLYQYIEPSSFKVNIGLGSSNIHRSLYPAIVLNCNPINNMKFQAIPQFPSQYLAGPKTHVPTVPQVSVPATYVYCLFCLI